MRTLPAPLAAAIGSGAATLATCWILTRKDGVKLGFTNHDAALTVEGVACEAASGWTAGAADAELGLKPGTATAVGALDSAAIAEADITAGLYDGAAVEAWRVDWSAPESRILLWRGTVSRLVREGQGFTAEIDGPLGALNRVVGRTYGKLCDAVLGDGRCRVDLADPRFAGAACDKRWSTCTGVFGNGLNFQGFPDIPGDDFLAATPQAGALNDGRSRR